MVRAALVFAALVALGVACFPPPLDERGLLCDDTRPCDTGYKCWDGVCELPDEIDAGPANWVQNPSFEILNDAGTGAMGWVKNGGGLLASADMQMAHTGLRAARLFVTDAGGNPVVLPTQAPVLNPQAMQTWCAQAFVKSNVPQGAVAAQIIIRERQADGGLVHDYASAKVPTSTTDWVTVSTSANTLGSAKLDVRVGFGKAPDPGQFLWVDDVALKRSIDGTCTW